MSHQNRRKRYRWETAPDSLEEKNERLQASVPDDGSHIVERETFPATQQYKRRFRWEQSGNKSFTQLEKADSDVVFPQYHIEGESGLSGAGQLQRPDDDSARNQDTDIKVPVASLGSPSQRSELKCGDGNREDDDEWNFIPEGYSIGQPSQSFSNYGSWDSGSSHRSREQSLDCVKTNIQFEFERLVDFIFSAELSNISHRAVQRLLKTKPIASSFSYRSLLSYSVKHSLLQNSSIAMCPNGHFARAGNLRDAQICPTCSISIQQSRKAFWYLTVSSALRGLCSAGASFKHIMNGCRKAKEFLQKQKPDTPPHDYYHGDMFFRNHARKLLDWDESGEVLVFLSLSTDGFECGRDRVGNKLSTWPVVSTVLNFPVAERSKASNMIIHAVIPGTHDPSHFETFLDPLVRDMRKLERGIQISCADGRVRNLKAFLMYFTADWPAASKVFGYAGHNARLFCRFCCKEKKYIQGLKMSCAVPEADVKEFKKALRGNASCDYHKLVELECPKKRVHHKVRDVWRELMEKNLSDSSRKRIAKDSGIKKKPSLSLLAIDFVSFFPYDVMHLVLLGWLKEILRLITGSHARLEEVPLPRYCIPSETMDKINRAMSQSSSGIPSCWGRPPLALEQLSRYKAEDLKRHAEVYLTPFLHHFKVHKKTIRLWLLTSRLVTLCFEFDCSQERVRCVREIVQELYARFVDLVYESESQAFCFTPSTHAILHIPDILHECGPLPLCSQFLLERLLGEIGNRIQHSPNLSAHIFHKNFRLLALRISNNGEVPTKKPYTRRLNTSHSSTNTVEDPGSEMGINVYCSGPGRVPQSNWLSHPRERCIGEFLRQHFPAQNNSRIERMREYDNATIVNKYGAVSVETFEAYQKRASKQQNCRQKHFIAAHFMEGECSHASNSSMTHSGSDSQAKKQRGLYYGSVRKIFQVKLEIRTESAESRVTIVVVDFLWQYDIIEEPHNGVQYTEGRQVTSTSTEIAKVIQRCIGIVNLSGRRYYLDKDRHSSRGNINDFKEKLRGVRGG